MTDEVWSYLGQLVRALQEYGVPGTRIGEHVAEISAHLEDSGADPVEEFGRPAQLAAELAEGEQLLPAWVRSLVAKLAIMTLGMTGASLIPRALAGPDPVKVSVAAVLPAVILGLLITTLSRMIVDRLDGHSGWRAIGWPVIAVWAGGAILVATLGGIGGGRGLDQTLFTGSRVAVLVVSGILITLAMAIGRKLSSPIRFPPHARHLDPLKRGFLAGRRPEAAGHRG